MRSMSRSRAFAIVVVTTALVGCRLDSGEVTTDAGIDAGSAGERCILVATTEFRSDGSLAVIDADSLQVWTDVTATHSDAHVRVLGDRVFVLNREGGGSAQELDPSNAYRTLSQRSIGRGTNPWGLAAVGDGTGWIALYNEGTLQHVDLSASAELVLGAPAPLPAPTELDGQAEPLDLFVFDGVLYVITQGLGEYPQCTPESRAHLHAFDPLDGSPVSAFEGDSSLELGACNTSGYSLQADGTLWLAHSGVHRVNGDLSNDGGLERVRLRAGQSDGVLFDEADFGDRDVTRVAANADGVWVAVAAADFAASVHRLDVAAAEVEAAVWESDTGGIFDLELAFNRLWVVDRSRAEPGVVVIDAATGELVGGPLNTGFPPFDLVGFAGDGRCGL